MDVAHVGVRYFECPGSPDRRRSATREALIRLVHCRPRIFGTLDANWRVQGITDAVTQLLGFRPEECLGVALLDAVHPDDAEAVRSFLSRVERDRSAGAVELRLRRRRPAGWERMRGTVARFVAVSPPPYVFQLVAPQPQERRDALHRVRDLEMSLERIGSEVRAVGIGVRPIPTTDPEDLARIAELTPRQREVLDLLMAGHRVPTIATVMSVSPSTIRNHLSSIFRKFGVHAQSQLFTRLYGSELPVTTTP
jgi:DNA-binding CsgD family transcriptional regulator